MEHLHSLAFWESDETKFDRKQQKLAKLSQIERLNQQHQNELRGRDRALQDHKRIIALKNAEISEGERRLRQTRDECRREVDSITENAEGERRRLIGQFASDVDDIKTQHAVELSQLAHDAQVQEEQLVSQHQHETKTLIQELQQLNAALLARDDEVYQGMAFTLSGVDQRPDDKIRQTAVELQQMVEQLGRLEWSSNQQAWPEQLLRRVENRHPVRMVKKAIVQDSIWSLLYLHIFCSPFRTFGDAGKQLEREWNEHYGLDDSAPEGVYTWPTPGISAERWRYMTIKECREALTKPLSQFDPRAALKKGYRSNFDNLVASCKSVVGSVIDLSPTDIQLFEKLVRKALLIWLDFSMHRCRLRLHLKSPEVESVADKVALAYNESLTLTVLPLVGRHGNVQGVELDSFTVVDGCAGDSLSIP